MNELDKLTAARENIGMLARGRDPITGADVSDDSVLNNIHICRCLLYVEEVLGRVADAGGAAPKKGKKAPFHITREQLDRYEFPPEPLPVTKITQRIDALAADDNMKKLCYRDITTFLVDAGALRTVTDAGGKQSKRPTPFGESLGIRLEHRQGQNGPYDVVLYDREAQKFILDNMESILAGRE